MNNHHLEITSGEAEVYASGSVISFDEKPITIEFGTSSTDTLKLTLEFKKDTTDKINIQAELLDKDGLKFIMTNMSTVLGGGNLEPIHIGKINDKKIYFSFRVYELNGSNQLTLLYTIYQYGKNET